MENYVVVPAPRSSDDWVELARARGTHGRLFKKHILNLGTLFHPKTGEKMTLGDSFYTRLHDNFVNGACDIVQVPLADAQNQHTEDPLRNLGEVVDIQREGDKVFAVMDIRDSGAADKMGKTLLGASAFMSMDYTDTRTNQKVGPTLLHTAVTNRPYVTDLDDYQEVIAATATADNQEGITLLLSDQEAEVPTKDELIAGLKEHGIDVEALQAAATAQPDVSALTAALTDALKPAGSVKLSNNGSADTITLTDIVGAVAELAATNGKLEGSVISLSKVNAEREVDGYIEKDMVLPKQRDAFIEMALTNRGMLETLLPDEPIVALSKQEGINPPDDAQREADLDAEIIRLTTSDDPKIKKFFDSAARSYTG